MRDPAFPVFCAVGAVLCALPLPWHWEARNTSTLVYLGWISTGCIVFLINSLVWAGNTNDVAPLWCDIVTRYQVGLSVGINASSLCIQRRLYRVATYNQAASIRDPWKREMIIDLLISVGLPVITMVLYHVVQVCRYAIIEDLGCWPYFAPTFLTIPMVLGWPVLLAAISFIYASLTIRAFIRTRRQFSQVLSDSGSNLSMSRYFRLMALAGTDMTFSLPLSLYFMIMSTIISPMTPWVSWEDTHKYVREVWQYSYEEIVSVPLTKSELDITKWSVPGCAFLFFAYFGLSGEAVRQYKSIFWRVAAPFGLKPPAPRPRQQSSSWSRRLAARITRSDPGDTTFPTTHTDLEVGQAAATDSVTHPERKQELVLPRETSETELKQTEA